MLRPLRRLLLIAALLTACTMPPPSVHDTGASRGAARLLILQSDHTPAFKKVTEELVRRWPSRPDVVVLDAVEDEQKLTQHVRGRPIVVAIGLRAAHAAQTLRQKTVFCQVFNYEEARLVGPRMKGVSALPPLAQQFALWKRIEPRLKRIGVMVGPHLQALIREARAAARAQGMLLEAVPVGSDMEVRYAVRRLAGEVQGLWLLPDNRILSRSVLREVLSLSYREGKSALVPSAELLPLGALISIEGDPADVAEQVLTRVRAANEAADVPGPDVIPLTRMHLRVNAVVAKRLGLHIPADMKISTYVPR